MGPEARIEKYVVARSRVLGAIVLKVQALAVRGFPDRLFVWHGGLIELVEFKAPEGCLSAAQKSLIGKFAQRDIDIQVVASMDAATRFLQKRRDYLARLKNRET